MEKHVAIAVVVRALPTGMLSLISCTFWAGCASVGPGTRTEVTSRLDSSSPAEAVVARKPRVLLLGDSIRMNYEPLVRESLEGLAEVVSPAENCQYSLYTLTSLQRWLDELGTPDIVHWNNGLHDLGYNPDRLPKQIPIELYLAHIETILNQLQDTGAQVIWATTTPPHPEFRFSEARWSWKIEDVDRYNAAALEIMRKYDVPVNDLNSIVISAPERYISSDLIHLSQAGQQKCAESTVKAISAYLPKDTNQD